MSFKQIELHLQVRVSRKTWETVHDIYSNVDVTQRIPVTLKSVSFDRRWHILKVYNKSPRKNYKQRVKSLFGQVWCAILHGLQLDS